MRTWFDLGRVPLLVLLVAWAACSVDWPFDEPATPESRLGEMITDEQLRAVRPSYGEWAGQNFSDLDLVSFEADAVPARIVEKLRRSGELQDVATALCALEPDEAQSAIENVASVGRPTWAEMGFVDGSGKGTTFAGRLAERAVAHAILEAVADELSRCRK